MVVIAGLVSPGVGLGAAPTFERIVVDETFVDEELAEACGVEMTVHLEGEIITRTFAREQTGPAVVRTIKSGGDGYGGRQHLQIPRRWRR